MKILNALKRTMAFVLTAAMLVTGVDSFGLVAFAEGSADQEIITNTDINGEVLDDVSLNDDSVIETPEEIVDQDVSENDDVFVISENDFDFGPNLGNRGSGPNFIVLSDYNGGFFEEYDTFAEAKEAIKDHYSEGGDYFTNPDNKITLDVFTDIELTGNNDFLDNEGISSNLVIKLHPSLNGDEKVYPKMRIRDNAKVETCARFEEWDSVDVRDDIRFWGEEDGSDGCGLVLGENSTFHIYCSSANRWSTSYLWMIKDPTSTGTVIVGKPGTGTCTLICLHIGTTDNKLNKLTCVMGADGIGAGHVNDNMNTEMSHGILSYDWDNTDNYNAYIDSHPQAATMFVKNAELQGGRKQDGEYTYSVRSVLGIYGIQNEIENLSLKGELRSRKDSKIKIDNITTYAGFGGIDLKGMVNISEKIEILGENVKGRGFDRKVYVTQYDGAYGTIYFPKSIITHTYRYESENGDYSNTFDTVIGIQVSKQNYDEYGNENGSEWWYPALGQTFFYIEASDGNVDQNIDKRLLSVEKTAIKDLNLDHLFNLKMEGRIVPLS